MRRYPAVAAPDNTLGLDMKFSNFAIKLFRVGARITSSCKPFQRGPTLFEKSCLDVTPLSKLFLIAARNLSCWSFWLFPLVDEAGPFPTRDGAIFGRHLTYCPLFLFRLTIYNLKQFIIYFNFQFMSKNKLPIFLPTTQF